SPLLARSCPRFERCSAGYCPAAGGVHLKDEPVCAWLREAVKNDGRAKIEGALAGDLAQVVLRDVRRLISTGGALGRELRRASASPSKIESGRRLPHGLSVAPGGPV